MILRFSSFGAWPMLVILSAAAMTAQIDRRPELKTRPVAWTEFDGSYLVDPNSRADMLDFYWTVLARPYPEVNWTGSLNPQVAGTTSELWRVREYAQLNAYRSIAGLEPIPEDATRLEALQQAALVMGLNDKVSHTIDQSWIGYSDVARRALADAELVGPFNARLPVGVVDDFIYDPGENNAATVGHRNALLFPAPAFSAVLKTQCAIGAASSARFNGLSYMALTIANRLAVPNVSASQFIAWPAPGYIPIALLRPLIGNTPTVFRWSFRPASYECDVSGAMITATIDGKSVAVKGQQSTTRITTPVTWEFDSNDLNPVTLRSDTIIEINVSNVFVRNAPQTYRYSVNLFDEAALTNVGFSPRTPLINISTRGEVGAGDRAMIVGFIVDGTLPVRVALRSQGRSLGRFGIQNTTRSTRLTLHDSTGKKLYENTSWKAHPNWRLLASTGVAPMQDNEAGMVVTLWPGSYTAILSDDADANGVGIVEAFNVDNLTSARLMNLSTRGVVSSGDRAMIAGFIIKNTPRTVVLRTQGPSLSRFGIPDPVADTMLRVVGSDGATIATNDDWRQAAENARLGSDLVPFAPLNDREAALVLTLQPGAYTAIVEAKGLPGIGIVELFDVL